MHRLGIGRIGLIGGLLYIAGVALTQTGNARLADMPMWALALAFLLIMCLYVFRYPAYHAEQAAWAVFGLIYVPVMLMCVYQTRILPDGAYMMPLIFLAAWGNDTCAYCVGMLFGRHKMTPVLSPKKSVEGAVGGVAGAVILGILYGIFLAQRMPSLPHPAAMCGLMCGAGALISIVGDLAASAVKRNKGIKDYGRLIPGHGGILDRFDSVIFTAPVVYVIARLMIR